MANPYALAAKNLSKIPRLLCCSSKFPLINSPSKISQITGLPWARSFSVCLSQSRRSPLFSIQRPPYDLGQNPEVAASAQTESAHESPYHFGVGQGQGVQHYHPESYPEGVSDDKGFFEDQEEPYENDYDEDDIRNGILEAALELVPTHGWTVSAIVAAAESYGYPGVAHGMFPGGASELANYFYAKCNRELREQLAAEADAEIPSQTAFVRDALVRRLKMTLTVKDTWSDAMATFASPEGAKGALNNLYELCDDIWYYAGDQSTDTNWYTKRALLAAVYKSTELYMLQDTSPDHQDTWDFLDRGLSGAVTVGSNFLKVRQSAENVAGSLLGAVTTAANLSGISKK